MQFPRIIFSAIVLSLFSNPAHGQGNCSDHMCINPGPVLIFCPGDSITLHAGGDLAVLPFTWSTGEGGTSITVTEPGAYTVFDASGCGTSTVQVMPFDVLAGNSTSTIYLCEGQSKQLWASAANGSHLWTDGSTAALLEVNEPGHYAVTSSFPCGEITHVYEVVAVPAGSIEMPTVYLCEKETVTLVCPESVPADYVQWGDGAQGLSIEVTQPGEYIARIIKDCVRIYRFAVEPNPDCPICEPKLPNVFTPNADGFYDKWGDYSACTYKTWNLRLFDRWGNLIFRSTDKMQGWDGTEGERQAPEGVYYYLLDAATSEREFHLQGHVTLLR